jgi:ribosomal protein S18 acetylase RimI-like enzyme
MQALAQRIWSKASRFHIGDLAWGRDQYAKWPTQLWELDGAVLAWGCAQSPGSLDFMVHPNHRELADEVLDWFQGVATGDKLNVTVLDGESHLIKALDRHGYAESSDGPFDLFMDRNLDDLPEPRLPVGFVARHILGDADVTRRAEVHRAAWSATLMPSPTPSRMTPEIHRQVMATWPYRLELDWIIEAPNGQFAACCIAWLDEKNRVGELEPVGTHPDFRRLGLASAVCLSALQALKKHGAASAVVYPRGDDAYPVPRNVYGLLGFKPYSRTRTYTRSVR